ncbi:MAG: hypothetical protein ACKN9E_02395 [Microcystaceae cyanobacterium]|nr:hypothetical protein [Merismopediaceae bacterium]
MKHNPPVATANEHEDWTTLWYHDAFRPQGFRGQVSDWLGE